MVGCRGVVLDGGGEEVEGMDDVFWGDGGLCEVVMENRDGV